VGVVVKRLKLACCPFPFAEKNNMWIWRKMGRNCLCELLVVRVHVWNGWILIFDGFFDDELMFV
jgi:hypothetical protein